VIDPLLEVHERIAAPELMLDVISRHELSCPREEQGQKLE
jgi:hypothetical protein